MTAGGHPFARNSAMGSISNVVGVSCVMRAILSWIVVLINEGHRLPVESVLR